MNKGALGGRSCKVPDLALGPPGSPPTCGMCRALPPDLAEERAWWDGKTEQGWSLVPVPVLYFSCKSWAHALTPQSSGPATVKWA